ncbi:MAG TPA: YWFCY domain-containing protein, partial [Puia sp.]|nr:YWFCY domain-containing protein [Puia sp.]
MDTGENNQGLRKVLELTRMISIVLLLLHFYYVGYDVFDRWKLTTRITDVLLGNIARTGLFASFNRPKFIGLGFLVLVLIGARGRKDERIRLKHCMICLVAGLLLYFVSFFVWQLDLDLAAKTEWYMGITSLGYFLIMTGGTLLSRTIQKQLGDDIFNKENETFPQEERLLTNEYSINLPAQYRYKGRIRKSWINIINPFRALLVIGSPGSGKSYFVIRHVIEQHISKGFTAFIYDFKYDDLTKLTYNFLQKYKSSYKIVPEFCVINFDDLSHSHRCNPLYPDLMF